MSRSQERATEAICVLLTAALDPDPSFQTERVEEVLSDLIAEDPDPAALMMLVGTLSTFAAETMTVYADRVHEGGWSATITDMRRWLLAQT